MRAWGEHGQRFRSGRSQTPVPCDSSSTAVADAMEREAQYARRGGHAKLAVKPVIIINDANAAVDAPLIGEDTASESSEKSSTAEDKSPSADWSAPLSASSPAVEQDLQEVPQSQIPQSW